jgi:hypothetical protein
MRNDFANIDVKGHLTITEKETSNVLLSQHNDIHPENFSLALAYSISNNGNYIKELALGNGGVRVNASQEYLYSSPQIIGKSATLYNETYYKVVDQKSSENEDSSRNYMTVSHVSGNVYTDILVHCSLEKNEPEGQNVINDSSIISEYTFSEVGLRTNEGDLITHLCFAPITKKQNITLIFDYLIRIKLV